MYVTYYNPLTVTYEVKYVTVNACTRGRTATMKFTLSVKVPLRVCVCVELCQHNRLAELHM